jgi:hypothetical protein
MRNDRRIFLAGLLAAAGSPLWLSAQQNGSPMGQANGQSNGSASRSGDPRNPTGAIPGNEPGDFPSDTGGRNPEPGAAAAPDPRVILKQDRKDLQHDADELADMSQDLKKQVDALDTTQILSLDLVHKAEAIEKLAHQIKTIAQGR